MKEEKGGKDQFLSPPCGLSTGDNSPFKLSSSSPPESIVERSTPPLAVSGNDQIETKIIGDGFLSEVSTPEFGSKNLQEFPPFTETEIEDQRTNRHLRQTILRPETERLRNVKTECAFRTSELLSPNAEKNCATSDRTKLANSSPIGNNAEEETEKSISTRSSVSLGQTESDHTCSPNRNLDGQGRKRSTRSEEKVKKKRLKTGISEKSRSRGSTQWAHLSEEELKKLRRVKNRESVEKCRTKQRLRMEALQVEQTSLRIENRSLREAAASIHDAFQDVSVQVTKMKDHLQCHVVDSIREVGREANTDAQASLLIS